jgi:hypothetical protein
MGLYIMDSLRADTCIFLLFTHSLRLAVEQFIYLYPLLYYHVNSYQR